MARHSKIDGYLPELCRRKADGASLTQLCAWLAQAHGVIVNQSTLCRALKDVTTFGPGGTAQPRPDNLVEARARFAETRPRKLVDEEKTEAVRGLELREGVDWAHLGEFAGEQVVRLTKVITTLTARAAEQPEYAGKLSADIKRYQDMLRPYQIEFARQRESEGMRSKIDDLGVYARQLLEELRAAAPQILDALKTSVERRYEEDKRKAAEPMVLQ